MVKLVVSNAAIVRLAWSYKVGNVGYNVIGARVGASTTINQALANTLDSAIKAAFTSSGMAPLIGPTVQLASVSIRDIRAPDLPEFVGTGTGAVGTGTGDPLPFGNAVAVTLRTALAGASHRGRVYLSGWTEAENDSGGGILAAAQTAAAAFISSIQSTFNTNGLTLAVVARPAEARSETVTVTHADGTTSTKTRSHPARPGGIENVTSIQVRNSLWDSQRRRNSPGNSSTLLKANVQIDV